MHHARAMRRESPRTTQRGAALSPKTPSTSNRQPSAKPPHRRASISVFVAAAVVLSAFGAAVPASASSSTHYVDCSGSTSGTGTQASPWNGLATVNSQTFAAGDTVYFKRGTTCSGALIPLGSGTAGSPITLDAYGTGAAPIIAGPTGPTGPEAAISLTNQNNWTIQNLEVTGGYWQNIHITATTPNTAYSGITIRNVHVHDNGWVGAFNQWVVGAGGIVIEPCEATTSISGILLDNVEANNNHIAGVQLGHYHMAEYDPASNGYNGENTPGCHMNLATDTTPQPKTGVQNVRVQYSKLHDNDATGLQVFGATNVLIGGNQLYNNGSGSGASPANPSGMNGEGAWWDTTDSVTAQWNNAWGNREGYSGNDGSGLDADRMTTNNLIQYNFLHDNHNYGASVIAGDGPSDAVIRYNIMSNNGTKYASAPDIMVSKPYATGGVTSLDIYNNTLTRASSGQGIRLQSPFLAPATVKVRNNLIYRGSASPMISTTTKDATLNNNLYFASGGTPTFTYNNTSYSSLAAFQTATGQDASSVVADPLMIQPSYHGNDWFASPQFALCAGSPAISAGVIVPSNGGTYIFSWPVNSTWAPNIGAYNGLAK